MGVDDRHLGYTQYSRDLEGEDMPCEWAPFSTRMDWEVARWAKLRGPSSTALSELLGINGVRYFAIHPQPRNPNDILLHSLRAHWVSRTQVPTNSTKSSIGSCRVDSQNSFEKRSRLLARCTNFITVISSNVFVPSTEIQSLPNS